MDIITFICIIGIICVLCVLIRLYAAGGWNYENRDLSRKTIVITGGTNGMGRTVVEQLANTGARIISCSRNDKVALEVIKQIKSVYRKSRVEHVHLDLNDLQSVKECAEIIIRNYKHIDILVNNAGVMMTPFGLTAQGYETQMGVNYLGHVLFTQKLLPLIEKVHGRIINLSSLASKGYYKKEFPFIPQQKHFISMKWYCESKLAMAIYAKELSRRNNNIEAASLHPGCVNTALFRYLPSFLVTLFSPLCKLIFKSPIEGSQTCLHLIHSENIINGAYYADCKVDKHNKLLDDQVVCDQLWNQSMELINPYL